MSRAPFFKLFFSDLAGDTLGLTDAEFGSYMLLLGAMWNEGGSLENNPARLGRIGRCSPKLWGRRWDALARFFTDDGGRLTNTRLLSERLKVESISAERSLSGKRGAEAKALKSNNQGAANEQANGKQPEPEPDSHSVRAQETPDQKAWQDGVALLTARGRMKESAARAFFAKLLKTHKLEPYRLLPSILGAELKGTQDPQAYLSAAAKALAQSGGETKPLAVVATWGDDVWQAALNRYRERGAWSETMGPKPDEPGCWAPASVLEEWRAAA